MSRHTTFAPVVALLAAIALTGCGNEQQTISPTSSMTSAQDCQGRDRVFESDIQRGAKPCAAPRRYESDVVEEYLKGVR